MSWFDSDATVDPLNVKLDDTTLSVKSSVKFVFVFIKAARRVSPSPEFSAVPTLITN